MNHILLYVQVDSVNICHKNYFHEPLCSSYTQKLFGLHGFLFATWMDVTVNGNGQTHFFQNLHKPTKLQNYFFIHIPKQQLSTYYKMKVAVPLFSEIV